jgi:hypothetical protein
MVVPEEICQRVGGEIPAVRNGPHHRDQIAAHSSAGHCGLDGRLDAVIAALRP